MDRSRFVALVTELTGMRWGVFRALGESEFTIHPSSGETDGPFRAMLRRHDATARGRRSEGADGGRAPALAPEPRPIPLDDELAAHGVRELAVVALPDGSYSEAGVLLLAHPEPRPVDAYRDLLGSFLGVTVGLRRESVLGVMRDSLIRDGASFSIADPSLPDSPLVYVSDGFVQLTGYAPARVLGRNCRFLQGDDRDQPGRADIARAVAEGRSCSTFLRNYRHDGTSFVNRLDVSPVRINGREAPYLLAVQRDVTRQHDALAATERDPLTGLLNQNALQARLENVLGAGRGGRLGLVLVHSQDFDEAAALIGEGASDELFRGVAARLAGGIAGVLWPFRFDDRTVALVVQADDGEAFEALVEDLGEQSTATIEAEGVPMRIEPILGVAPVHGDEDLEAAELIRRARVAMHHAVEQGAEVQYYTPTLERSSLQTVQLLTRAAGAIEAGEFEVHYQRKYDFRAGGLDGAEGLVRWRREGRLLPPRLFLPRLERTRLINPLTRFVIRDAISSIAEGVHSSAAVNFTARSIHDRRLLAFLVRELELARVDPERFEIEITENALMHDVEAAIVALRRLREHGIRVAIDDFGTGQASYAWLRKLPANRLKIDRAFVAPLEGDDAISRPLLAAMIDTGHALGMEVTAEGVEHEYQARVLAELGCDLGQGFLWDRPSRRPEAAPHAHAN